MLLLFNKWLTFISAVEQPRIPVQSPKVIVCADYDNPNDPDNIKIQQYCASNGYDLVWMNVDVEDVFLGRTVSKKMKNKELMNFLKHKESFLSTNTVLNDQTPLAKRPASNLLNVLDKYLRRKT